MTFKFTLGTLDASKKYMNYLKNAGPNFYILVGLTEWLIQAIVPFIATTMAGML